MRCGRCSSAAFQVTLEWDLIAGHHDVAAWTGFISSLSVVVFLVQLKPDPLLRLPQYVTCDRLPEFGSPCCPLAETMGL